MTTLTAELDRELARRDDRDRRTRAVAPPRSLAQRQAALLKANRVRTVRADLKRDLKAGRRLLVDVLADVDEGREPDLETMHLFELLLAVPKCGRVKANVILQRARISPSKTLGGLSARQRRELVRALWTYPSMR